MALIKCKDCQQAFSTDAQRCPHCGAKKPASGITKYGLLLLGILALPGLTHLIFPTEPTVAPEPTSKYENEQLLLKNARNEGSEIASSAAKSLKKALRNPDSLKISEAAYNKSKKTVCLVYRAQNGFGGMNVSNAIYAESDGWHTAEDRNFKVLWRDTCSDNKTIALDAGHLIY